MVAQINTEVQRRENRCYDWDHKHSQHKSYSAQKNSRASPSTMKITDADKDNHFIEAIVFTTDFLSCTEKPTNGSPWICGSGDSAEAIEVDERSSYNDNGCFGVKQRQLISYKNTEDLTRKIDALFHRKRSLLSAGAAAKIRDDLSEDDDCCHEHESSDHRFFSNLQRRIDDAASTCPSTNPSLSQDELNQWYSSSWSSFTYYGSAKETYGVPTFKTAGSAPKRHRPMQSHPSRTSRREPSFRPQRYDKRANELEGCDSINLRSSSSLPDFLKGVEFKNRVGVISLPPSPLNSFSSWSKAHGVMVYPKEAPILGQKKKEKKKKKSEDSRRFASKKKISGELRHRRVGQKTRDYLEKAKGLFRR